MNLSAGGFYSEEIGKDFRRVGFRVVTLDGKEASLAHVSLRQKTDSGKYGVDVDAINHVAIPAVYAAIEDRQVIVIDEIGPMQLKSPAFETVVDAALNASSPVIGTINQSTSGYIGRVKARADVRIIKVTLSNRDALPARLRDCLQKG